MIIQLLQTEFPDLHHIFKGGCPPGELIRGFCALLPVRQSLISISALKDKTENTLITY